MVFLSHNACSHKLSRKGSLKPSISEKAWFFGEIHKSQFELNVPHACAAELKGFHRASFHVGERVVGLEPGLHLDGISADLTLDWGWGGCSKYS